MTNETLATCHSHLPLNTRLGCGCAALEGMEVFLSFQGDECRHYFVMCTAGAAKDILRGVNHRAETVTVGLSAIVEPTASCDGTSREIQTELRSAIGAALNELTELERAVTRADLDAGGKASNKELASVFNVTPSAITHARSSAQVKLSRLLADFDPYRES